MELKEALTQLDPTVDAHWTSNGNPRISYLIELTGNETLTRMEVTDAAPEFTRETAPESTQEEQPPSKHVARTLDSYTREEIFSSEILLERFADSLGEKAQRLAVEEKRIQTQLREITEEGQLVAIALQPYLDARPKESNVEAFLNTQDNLREQRIQRNRRFQELGITQQEFKELLGGNISALDAAMNQRKPAPGTTRPDTRIPVGA